MDSLKDIARKHFAKNNLEGERPTQFFCSMNKKMKSRAQFEEVHIKEKNERGEETIRVVTKQSSVEWEVRKFYWKPYRKEQTLCNKQDILERIGKVKGISEHDKCQLEKEITMEEVSNTLKIPRTMSPLVQAGSWGHFIKCFDVI